MKIAILGTGHVGSALGANWAAGGREVIFGSRDPQADKAKELAQRTGAAVVSVSEAAAAAEICLLASPWSAVAEILQSVASWEGKTLIDCINPINAQFSGLETTGGPSASEQIAAWAPQAKVVKAFNTLSAAVMADADFAGERAAAFYCGDDEAAKEQVRELAEAIGLQPVDVGPHKNAQYMEAAGWLYIQAAIHGKREKHAAMKLLKR